MNDPCATLAAPADPDLETVLAAWQTATDRLQRTHESLRAEVRRLTGELEAKNRALERTNRLADLGRMASHVAHEVRNSLVPVTLYLSLLRRRVADDPCSREILDNIDAGFTALEATVNDLLQFTADRTPNPDTLLVEPLVHEVCGAVAPQLESQGIDVAIDVPGWLTLRADRQMLRRALLNLLLNALDAMPAGGELVITGCRSHGGVELEVADSGPGIHPRQASRLFEPFYSTKSGGTGLGLSIVCRIAEAHGGRVTATNCPEGGAAFTIAIPTARVREVAA